MKKTDNYRREVFAIKCIKFDGSMRNFLSIFILKHLFTSQAIEIDLEKNKTRNMPHTYRANRERPPRRRWIGFEVLNVSKMFFFFILQRQKTCCQLKTQDERERARASTKQKKNVRSFILNVSTRWRFSTKRYKKKTFRIWQSWIDEHRNWSLQNKISNWRNENNVTEFLMRYFSHFGRSNVLLFFSINFLWYF